MKKIILLLCVIILLHGVSAIINSGSLNVTISLDGGETWSSSKQNTWACDELEQYKSFGAEDDVWSISGDLNKTHFLNQSLRINVSTYGIIGPGFAGAGRGVDHVRVRVYYLTSPSINLTSPTPANNSAIGSTLRVNATSDLDLDVCFLESNHTGSYSNYSMTIESSTLRSCYLTIEGLKNTTYFRYRVYGNASNRVNMTDWRYALVNNTLIDLTLNSPSSGITTPNTTLMLNWTAVNREGDEMYMTGYLSQNLTIVNQNSSQAITYFNSGNLNGSFAYNFTALPTPLNSTGLWALYKFENLSSEGENFTIVKDYGPYSKNGTFIDTQIIPTGKFGRGLRQEAGPEINGDDEVKLQHKDFANISINGMTVNAWIYMEDNNTFAPIASRYSDTNNDRFFYFQINLYPSFWIGQTGAFNPSCVADATTASLAENRWYMVTGVYDDDLNITQVYVDGRQIVNSTCPFDEITQSSWQDTENVYLGGGDTTFSEGLYTNDWPGVLDEIGFWNRSLTAQEISDLYSLKNGTYFWKVRAEERINNFTQSQVWNFTIDTTVTDPLYPIFSSFTEDPANNTDYTAGTIFRFNATVVNTNGTVFLNFNGTNYPATNLSSVFNATVSNLNASTYSYYWWAYGNGTNKNINQSATRYYTVRDQYYPIFSSFTEDPANNTVYSAGASYKFNSTITFTNGTVVLSFNGTNYTASNLSSVYNVTLTDLAAGTYSYYWASYGNGTLRNYNQSSLRYYTIAKVTGVVNGTINNTHANFSALGAGARNIWLNATNVTGFGTGKIYLNGVIINSGTMPLANLTNLTAGQYNATFVYDGNQNYTSAIDTLWIDVDTLVTVQSNSNCTQFLSQVLNGGFGTSCTAAGYSTCISLDADVNVTNSSVLNVPASCNIIFNTQSDGGYDLYVGTGLINMSGGNITSVSSTNKFDFTPSRDGPISAGSWGNFSLSNFKGSVNLSDTRLNIYDIDVDGRTILLNSSQDITSYTIIAGGRLDRQWRLNVTVMAAGATATGANVTVNNKTARVIATRLTNYTGDVFFNISEYYDTGSGKVNQNNLTFNVTKSGFFSNHTETLNLTQDTSKVIEIGFFQIIEITKTETLQEVYTRVHPYDTQNILVNISDSSYPCRYIGHGALFYINPFGHLIVDTCTFMHNMSGLSAGEIEIDGQWTLNYSNWTRQCDDGSCSGYDIDSNNIWSNRLTLKNSYLSYFGDLSPLFIWNASSTVYNMTFYRMGSYIDLRGNGVVLEKIKTIGQSGSVDDAIRNSANDTFIIDSNISDNSSSFFRDIRLIRNTNITIINTNYFDEAMSGTGSATLYRQWYVDVNLLDSSNNFPISSGNVSYYNRTDSLTNSALTNSSGTARANVTEYVSNGTTRFYWTNYTINGSKDGYYNNSLSYNVTSSVSLNLLLTPINTCIYRGGDWNINCSHNCILSTGYDLNRYNASLKGSGSFSTGNFKITNWTYLYTEAACLQNYGQSGGFQF